MRYIFECAVVVALLTSTVFSQWEFVARKDGADVSALYKSPSGTLYAQLTSGAKIFRSYDGGIQWNLLELPSTEGGIQFAPCVDSLGIEALTVLAGRTLFRSTDDGISWHELFTPQGMLPNEELVDIRDLRFGPLVLITSSSNGAGLYISRDNGNSAIRLGDLPRTRWHFFQAQDSAIYCYSDSGLYRVQIHPPQTIRLSSDPYYSLTSSQEYQGAPVVLWAIRGTLIVRSTTGGTQWDNAMMGLQTLLSGSILLGGREGSVFAFVRDSSGGTRIYKRYAGAASWSLISTQQFNVRDAITTLSGTILVATADGVFLSEENGMFWSNSSSGIQGIGLECAAHLPPSFLVAISTSGQIYRSLNGGMSWASSGTLPLGTRATDAGFKRPAIVIGTRNGLWCSLDQGISFSQCSTATNAISDAISSIAHIGDFIAASGTQNIYVSSDGVSWTTVVLPLPPQQSLRMLRSADTMAVISTEHTLLRIESITPLSLRTIATSGGTIQQHDIAADGTIGVIVDSAGSRYYQRFNSSGRLEVTIPLPSYEIQTMALSRGGTAYIAPMGSNYLYVVGRTQSTLTLDSSIDEPVLYLRRQENHDLIATTAYGAIYRVARDSILSTPVPTHSEVMIAPTPAAEQITITAPTDIEWVTIYSLSGTIVKAQQCTYPLKQMRVDVGMLGSGYFIVVIHTRSGTTVQPLVIVR